MSPTPATTTAPAATATATSAKKKEPPPPPCPAKPKSVPRCPNPFVERLKRSWKAYSNIAAPISKSFDSKDKSAILTWHYRTFRRLDGDGTADYNVSECRHCQSVSRDCSCYSDLKAW